MSSVSLVEPVMEFVIGRLVMLCISVKVIIVPDLWSYQPFAGLRFRRNTPIPKCFVLSLREIKDNEREVIIIKCFVYPLCARGCFFTR